MRPERTKSLSLIGIILLQTAGVAAFAWHLISTLV